jgi:hypothetical protein
VISQHSILHPWLKRSIRGGAPGASFRSVLREDPCCWCGMDGGTLDHIYPAKNKSSNAREKRKLARMRALGVVGAYHGNLSGACERCNKERGCRSILEFLIHRSRHD